MWPPPPLAFVLLAAVACGGKTMQVGTAGTIGSLFLNEAPPMVARLEYQGPERTYAGPARLEVQTEKEDAELPIRLAVEDYAMAEQVECRVISTKPVAYGPVAGNPWRDVGTFVRDRDRLILRFTRTHPDGQEAKITILGNMAPKPIRPPRDWLAPGTTLYYGITYDDKPITKLVPMGMNITVVENGDTRVFDWYRDLDPATQTVVTGELSLTGRRSVSKEVAERARMHADTFTRGEDAPDTTSIFLPRVARKNLSTYGAAAWEDAEVGEAGLLERTSKVEVVLQADDNLWAIPATVATANKGAGIYIIADDSKDPLILSASRPSYQMKLMAVGRPR